MALDFFTSIDLVLLAVFLAFFSFFLYTRKHNLKREGLLFLYKTSWGIKLIERIGKKYKKTLKVLSVVSVFCGYVLMFSAFYLIYTIVKVYIFNPAVVRAIKVPPILPLVPYLPQAFKLSFLPPFYFTYWIIILAIIAIFHEMAHGIFAAYNKVKIKTTGFGFFPFFLPIFLAAFVELDEKKMAKKSRFSQMAVLSAGTFANVITAILFFVVLWVFFSMAFIPSGVTFDSYATSQITIAGISAVGGINISNVTYEKVLNLTSPQGLTEIDYGGRAFLTNKDVLESQSSNNGVLIVYDSAPAIKANLTSIILEIDGAPVRSIDDLANTLSRHKVGDNITVTTKTDYGIKGTLVTLEEHPQRPGTAWLGVGFINKQSSSGLIGKIVEKLSSFRKPGVYYEPRFDGISVFIYNLLWWIVLICVSVAIMNMLPVGIFDGGRFFYLTILAITGNEKFAKKSFAFSTYFFLFILFLLLFFWGISFFR